MALQPQDIAAKLKEQILAFEAPLQAVDVGSVMEVGDGIARASGLAGVMAMELVEFPPKPGRDESVMGLAFNLEADNVGIIIMGDHTGIEEDDLVQGTGRIVSVPVGGAMIGRVVNALGEPVDGKGPIAAARYRNISEGTASPETGGALVLPDGREFHTEGVCEGVIQTAPSGEGGFGYDPVFFLPEQGCTMAELSFEAKNRISHRARAAQAMRRVLEQL